MVIAACQTVGHLCVNFSGKKREKANKKTLLKMKNPLIIKVFD